MKKNHFYYLSLLFLLYQFAPKTVNAQVTVFVTIQGEKSGIVKGTSMQRGNQGKIECSGVRFSSTSPVRSTSTGITAGRANAGTVTIIKNFDTSSPQLLQSYYSNEFLKIVTIEFYKGGGGMEPKLIQKITLTNAVISEIAQYEGVATPDKSPANNLLEEISFSFQKIETTYDPAQTNSVVSYEVR